MNNFNIAGRLVKDVEAKTKNGKIYSFITVAVNMGKDNTEFLDITLFGKTAEITAQYGKKGDSIGVTGYIHKNGKDRDYTLSLIGNSVSFLSNKKEG